MVNFELTEAEVVRLTGYSRETLRVLRNGGSQVKKDVEYKTDPVLIKGKDYERYGNRAVFYSRQAVEKLKQRKGNGNKVRELRVWA